MGYNNYGWGAYVTVAEKKVKAAKKIASLIKKGKKIQPITIGGHSIAKTFWGKAWCKNLESYSDYVNRLPRGRSYVRHGSVIDLKVAQGSVQAMVNGSSLYNVSIDITAVAPDKWKQLVAECSGKIDSLIELLQGKFSKSVMEIITLHDKGLFPSPSEIKMSCTCPDHARLCKHVAAALYGIGARLDENPEWLFLLRQVDHLDLICSAATQDKLAKFPEAEESLSDDELSSILGIEIEN